MKESTTYQKILREGREEGREEGRIAEARRFLIVVATARLGDPDDAGVAALESVNSVDRLEAMGRRLISDPTIGGWDDLLRGS